jgi:hypothetical protein
MTERGGVRVAVSSGDLAQQAPEKADAPSGDADVDRILAMVELDPKGAEVQRARRRNAAIVGVVVLILAVIAVVVMTGRP